MKNFDKKTVIDFGKEWSAFDQKSLSSKELDILFNDYFAIFPLEELSSDAIGYDLGCGSGRWASVIAPKVGKLICIDASNTALAITKKNLARFKNVEFLEASVDNLEIADNSMDFGYSLGVLHHIPDTEAGIKACVSKLKKGAPLLLYLYYAFDNKPTWYRHLWALSNVIRKIVSKLPFRFKYFLSQLAAACIYFPLARLGLLLDKFGFDVNNLPLSAYRHRSFYVMRTDALDRFGTRLEKRFTKTQITMMMEASGLEKISFHNKAPFWCAIGYKI